MKLYRDLILSRDFRYVFLMVLTARLGYLYIFGIYLSPESLRWVEGNDLFSPPLYPLLFRWLLQVPGFPWGIVALQTGLFSAAIALLSVALFNSRKLLYLFATAVALDPNSAHFAAAISPEALFLTFTGFTLACFHLYLRNPSPLGLSLVIIGSACAFLTHYQGLILPIACLGYLLFFPIHRRYFFRTALIFIVGFQACLLPFRLLNANSLDTWRINALTGYSLWNNASMFYCNSVIRSSPRTDFETWLAYKPCSEYTSAHALNAWHLSDPGASVNQYIRKQGIQGNQLTVFTDDLFRTAMSIIIQHPADYLMRFCVPNLKQIYQADELRNTLPATYAVLKPKGHVPMGYMYFNRYFALIVAGLMVFNLLFQAYYHRTLGFLSLFNVGYLISIGIMGPVKCGDFMVLTPCIFLNLFFLWDKLFYRNIYFRFAYRGL